MPWSTCFQLWLHHWEAKWDGEAEKKEKLPRSGNTWKWGPSAGTSKGDLTWDTRPLLRLTHEIQSSPYTHLFPEQSFPGLPSPHQPFKGFQNPEFLVLNHLPFKAAVEASVTPGWNTGLLHASQIRIHGPAPEGTGDKEIAQKHSTYPWAMAYFAVPTFRNLFLC